MPGVLNIVCNATNQTTGQSTFNLTMRKSLICPRVRLVNYAIELVSGPHRLVRVSISWLGGLNNNMTATFDRDAQSDDLISFPMSNGTYTRESVDGIEFAPSNNIIPAAFTVRTFDRKGDPIPVKFMSIILSHNGHAA